MLSWYIPTISWSDAVSYASHDLDCMNPPAEISQEQVTEYILRLLAEEGVVAQEVEGHCNSEGQQLLALEGDLHIVAVIEGSPLDQDFDEQGLYGAGVVLTAGGHLKVCGGVYNGGSTYFYSSSTK